MLPIFLLDFLPLFSFFLLIRWSKGCGSNSLGQLALAEEKILEPTVIPSANSLMDVKLAVCGDSHTLFLTRGGNVLCCGSNLYGQVS